MSLSGNWSKSNWKDYEFCDQCHEMVRFLVGGGFKFISMDVCDGDIVCPNCENKIVCDNDYFKITLEEMNKKKYEENQE